MRCKDTKKLKIKDEKWKIKIEKLKIKDEKWKNSVSLQPNLQMIMDN